MAALAMPTNSSTLPQTHRVSGRGRNVSDEGVKRAVSRRVWPPCRHGNSGTVNIAAPKDSTTRAAKDGPVWFHCSAPAVRYEAKCGADSARANHSENEPSIKGLSVFTTLFTFYCRGVKFRKEFGRLGELRGFFPTDVHTMALTATASKSTRKFVSNALGMEKPHLVILSPDKPNIVYNMVTKTGSIDATFSSFS